ncbi:hypothetical protein HCN44_002712 [Aphidius gifuensis]|uniref:Solute carrier organic anion transporter family member n=1 Tax=Aphidius gifuensis TaxID=684658 RepID=A0A834XSN4_APHGI|nr:hypothetical protein HCN44_002712 [Aphidius gifuensis]
MVEINLPKEKNHDADDKLLWNGTYKIIRDQPYGSPVDESHDAVDGSNDAVNKMIETMVENRDIECGISCFRGSLLQKFANKKAFVIAYGICSLMLTASAGYYIAIGSTLEKIFKISSVTAALISNGNNIGLLITCNVLSYCANKGHKPRWMAAGLFIMTISCCLFFLTHIIYGPGQDLKHLTNNDHSDLSIKTIMLHQRIASLCHDKEFNTSTLHYDHSKDGNIGAQMILFTARFLHGISDAVLFSLGLAYMDDNIKKSKIPILIGISYLIKMAGPSIGFQFSAITLSKFILLNSTPSITPNDPRWLGAWWLGWIVFSVIIFIMACIMMCFPKTLPRAEARRLLALRINQSNDNNNDKNNNNNDTNKEVKEVVSFWSTIEAFIRLAKNKTLVCINIASVLFVFGYCPFWYHVVKYIEVVYQLSASVSASETGNVSLWCGGLGIILSGIIVATFKPSARYLAGFNAFSCGIACLGILSYTFINCAANENQIIQMKAVTSNSGRLLTCTDSCTCEFSKYNPICTEDNRTFVSPCHAGCQHFTTGEDGSITYTKCSCVNSKDQGLPSEIYDNHLPSPTERLGTAKPGACKVDCTDQKDLFMIVFSVITFIVSAGAVPSFLLSLRCVDKRDKALTMGVNLAIIGLFALMISPIIFARIFDDTCLFWGKTNTSSGNCWLYDSGKLRYRFNLISAAFVGVGTFFYMAVWYLVRDLKIFDDEKNRAVRF